MEDHNAEIWSTRVQKELLALTTDAESTEEDRSVIPLLRESLPPFVKVQNHALDIATGTCVVSFEIEAKKDAETLYTIVVTLDASMPHRADGSIIHGAPCYPFASPKVTLTTGQESFPNASTIKNGDYIAMDIDWTPSLHLTDAVMNIGLKIRESILQGEPFHAAPADPVMLDPVDEVTKSARRLASSIAKNASSFGKAFSAPPKKPRQKKKTTTSPATAGEVKIGDEISLLEEPWVAAHGVYSCKAIRRPPFVEKAMTTAAEKGVLQPGFSSPSNMFRSFAQSARGVLEESFLMITETHIIEMKSSKLNLSTGTVVFAIPIEMLGKLKFRRKESISLFFKPAPNDPLIYMCPDSGDAVHQIQSVLKRHGVKGKHTNAAAFRAINDALQLVQEIQTKELALKHDPTVQRVNEIMDLYRQAAERFEVAGDIRHEEVVTHMRKFLALPLTASILDGSFKRPTEPPKPVRRDDGVPVGEVLERPDYHDDDLDFSKEKENDKAFEENMDNLLKEAKEDFAKFTANLDVADAEDSALADVAADLDAMMKEADKELAALMNS